MQPSALVRRSRLAAVTVLLLIVALLPTAAAGAEEPQVRTLLSEVMTKPGWRAYKVRSDGNWFKVRFDIPKANKPVQVGGYYYRADDTFLKGFTHTAFVYQDCTTTTSTSPPASGWRPTSSAPSTRRRR